MIFKCNKNNLYEGLQNVTKAIAARPMYQLLEGIQIVAKADSVELTCSDGSVFIRSIIEAKVDMQGSVVVAGRLFTDLIKRLPDGEINIEVNDKKLISVKYGISSSKIVGQSDNEFPAMKTMFQSNCIHLPQKKLKDMISKVMFAVAVGDVRQTLNGCLMEVDSYELRLVGLDGYKLSLQIYNDNFILPQGTSKLSCIIPGKILSEVGSMLKDDDDMITIHMDGTHVMFIIDNTFIVSALYTGNYVNYRAILPAEWESRVSVRRVELQGAVERAGLIARESKSNIVKLKAENQKLVITSYSERGDVYEEIDAEIDGKPVEIAFNGRYISEVIRNISDEFTSLFMNGSNNPCIIKPKDKENYTYLVMSVRI